MIGLFFEVEPRDGHLQPYLDIAAALRPELEQNPGLISIERFRCLDQDGLILSNSQWRDEAHLARWRANSPHYKAQLAGRNTHFQDYRLRIGARAAEATEAGVTQTPLTDPYNDAALRPPRWLLALSGGRESAPEPGLKRFASLYREGAHLGLRDVRDQEEGIALAQAALASGAATEAGLYLISRDYGMFAREEAPQFMR